MFNLRKGQIFSTNQARLEGNLSSKQTYNVMKWKVNYHQYKLMEWSLVSQPIKFNQYMLNVLMVNQLICMG